MLTLITARLVEARLGAGTRPTPGEGWADADEEPEVSPEARGARPALRARGRPRVLVAITLLTAIPGAPLRDPRPDKVIGDSPFMDSLIVIIMLIFFVAGYAYGRGAGTIKRHATT